MRQTRSILALLTLLALAAGAACAPASPPRFGIYLAKTGELVLSEEHLTAYDRAEHHLLLNDKGTQRINSYHTYTGAPKVGGPLYQQEFVMKFDGREVCRGTLTSGLSSMLYAGVTIMDVVLPLDREHNWLWIHCSYPAGYTGARYDNLFTELDAVFTALGLAR